MPIQVYGIPTCGTCKKATQWLDRNQIPYEFVNTKDQPPTVAMIQSWVAVLGALPLRNTSGQSYRALGDAKQGWGDAEWIAAFAQDAMLLKRPVFVKDGQAVIVGFRDADAVMRQKLGL